MSAFRHVHNVHVRPLEEELAEMGLNPGKVLFEIDRNTAMLEGGPTPLDLAGLHEGSDDVPRSLAQYGSTLLDEKRKSGKGSCKGGKGDDEDDDDDKKDDDEKDDDDEDEKNGNGKGCTGAYDKGGEGKKGRGRGMGVGQGKGPIGRRAMEDDIVPGSPSLIEKQWIQQAIKDPGRVREYLGVPEGEKIPAAKLDEAISKLSEDSGLFSVLVLARRFADGGIPESLGITEASGEVDGAIEGIKKDVMGIRSGKIAASKGKDVAKSIEKFSKDIIKYGSKADVKRADDAIMGLQDNLSGYESDPWYKDVQKALAKAAKSMVYHESIGEAISGEVVIDEDTISDALYLINEGWELTEVFQIVKKQRGAAARLAKRLRHRMYLMHRGEKKLAAKIFR